MLCNTPARGASRTVGRTDGTDGSDGPDGRGFGAGLDGVRPVFKLESLLSWVILDKLLGKLPQPCCELGVAKRPSCCRIIWQFYVNKTDVAQNAETNC